MDWKYTIARYHYTCADCRAYFVAGSDAWWNADAPRGKRMRCRDCTTKTEGVKLKKEKVKGANRFGFANEHPLFDADRLMAFKKADLITIGNEMRSIYRVSSRSKADLARRIAEEAQSVAVKLEKYDAAGGPFPLPEWTKKSSWERTDEEKERHDELCKSYGRDWLYVPNNAINLAKWQRVLDDIGEISGIKPKAAYDLPEGSPGKELRFKSEQIDEVQEKLEKQVLDVCKAQVSHTRTQTKAMRDTATDELLKTKNRMMREVRQHLTDLKIPQQVDIRMPDGEIKSAGHQHHRFGDLAGLIGAGITVLMVGPAGSGKSTAPKALAEAMGRRFLPISLGPHTMQSQIVGHTAPDGGYCGTPFRDHFENGGVILLDELDRCNERVAVTLNAALANRICSFPDKVVEQHPECIIVAAGNTAGHGADRQYVSARQQDAALLDRFAVLEWGYDEGFELALAKQIHVECELWVEKVWRVRELVAKHRMRYVVSPRTSLQGAQGLAAGLDPKLLESTVMYRGWKAEDREKIEREMGIEPTSNKEQADDA